ncbi:hypothetical protein ABIA32_000479 [Streptacidiphilus sp. MAP12-20]|uniref:hypothetical protein n=1 Tax=Streptacidiphilus sp. MAP12-20 TaxID=3156299 RepID=UPI00351533F8
MRDSQPNPRRRITINALISTGWIKPWRSGVIAIEDGMLALATTHGLHVEAPIAEVTCKRFRMGQETLRITLDGTKYLISLGAGTLDMVKAVPPLYVADMKSAGRVLVALVEQAAPPRKSTAKTRAPR